MKFKMLRRIMAALLCVVMCVGALAGCNNGGTAGAGAGNKKPEALVIMTEELDGLFNPFYSTTANDGTIVAMTQISMLTTGVDSNGEVIVAVGDNEAVVVKAYSITEGENDTTVYTFVLKNGIKFSDGKPLTMNDVLFNMYVYLDPVYTGSSTMYSTDIVGLKDYRTQTQGAGDSTDEALEESAANLVNDRITELVNVYLPVKNNPNLTPDYDTMVEMITAHNVTNGYKQAVSAKPNTVTSANLLADYNYVLELFKQELAVDFESAVSNYADNKTYTDYKGLDFSNPITAFMALEGFITFDYLEVNGKEDKSVIVGHHLGYGESNVTTKQAAIDFVFKNMIESDLTSILYYSRSSSTIINEYTSNAKAVLLAMNRDENGGLLIPNIEGIKSLGHNTDLTEIEVDGTVYAIAQEHNADGTVAVEGTYDVLQITINGVDPKAIWNFAFSVAPQHYYGKGQPVNIEENQFGVVYGSFDFMKNTVQANNKVPMGAGPYMATDASNRSNPSGTDFYRNNVVYFKANPHFMMGKAKIEKLRYQVVSSANALSALESGSVHFVTPQFTQNNINKINSLSNKGIKKLSTDQLGYGYIGINAGKVDNIYLRKAIMSAMDTSRALNYYSTGTAENIYWPMSTVSWAYPKTEDGELDRDNGYTYPAPNFSDDEAIAAIKSYMQKAGVAAGDSKLKIKFTIAGANMTEHPVYQVFQKAAQLLNECGWDITVVPDIQALTKLSTGSLEVWAAAWGSTVDPDMYQVYHKNSTATSTLAWGYDKIVNNSNYPMENSIINELSDVIERARETEDRETRSELYKEAMGYILDLAIELPVYQRDVLYAYDSNVIKASSLPSTLNPYTSPLDRIWEIEFAK